MKKGASKNTLLNFGKVKKVAEAALSSVTVDEKASTSSLMRMALAFKSASGDQGISGSVYWTDPGYYVDGVGSSVLRSGDVDNSSSDHNHGFSLHPLIRIAHYGVYEGQEQTQAYQWVQ